MYSSRPPSPERRTVEGMTRDEACRRYQAKILYLARRLAGRIPDGAGLTREDLASYGAIGLLEAFDLFDENLDIRFGTYAEYRIRGAMLDALRAVDTMSRRRRMLARRIEQAATRLAQELGERPPPEQVAEALEMDLDAYWAAVDVTAPVNQLSLDETAGGGDEDGLTLAETRLADADGDALSALLDQDSRRIVREAIGALPEQHRQCVLLYYGRDMTLAEIGKVFGVTASRISQVLSDARRRLEKALQGQEKPPGAREAS